MDMIATKMTENFICAGRDNYIKNFRGSAYAYLRNMVPMSQSIDFYVGMIIANCILTIESISSHIPADLTFDLITPTNCRVMFCVSYLPLSQRTLLIQRVEDLRSVKLQSQTPIESNRSRTAPSQN